MFKKKEKEIVSTSKDDYIKKKKTKKRSKLKQLNSYLKLISFKNLNYHIQSYGYDYSLAKYTTSIFVLLFLIVVSGNLFHLNYKYLTYLAFFAVILFPVIVLSQVKFIYNNYRFEQMTTYLQEMITIFKMKPKILYSLEEINKLFEEDKGINKYIQKAIYHIQHGTSEDGNIYSEALEIIEREYPCSRVRSLHNLMTTVENQNSIQYQDSLNDLYEDIQCWISRTYDYQIQLKNTKFQFSIILLLTIGVASAMVNVLPENLLLFVSGTPYQIISMLMLGIFISMFCLVQSKLSGQWLVNDIEKDDKKILKSIHYIENFDKKKNFKDSIIKALIVSVIPVIGFMQNNKNLMYGGILASIIMYFYGELQYKSHFKNVEKEIRKTFPVWLRDITLNMHNLVVSNAIRQSYINAPTVMKYYLDGLINDIENDPVSIRPYNNFLKKFYINDISSAMKCLYSIKEQTSKSSNSSKQISDLIIRNQRMMEVSERIRNENQIAGMGMIGGVPMVIGSFKLMADMMLMLGTFMSSIQMPM